MTKIALASLTLAFILTGCNSYNPTKRDLPLTDNVVPLPVLCRKIKASEDVRATALYNRYCAVQNQQRLVSARVAYEKVRECYSGGNCN